MIRRPGEHSGRYRSGTMCPAVWSVLRWVPVVIDHPDPPTMSLARRSQTPAGEFGGEGVDFEATLRLFAFEGQRVAEHELRHFQPGDLALDLCEAFFGIGRRRCGEGKSKAELVAVAEAHAFGAVVDAEEDGRHGRNVWYRRLFFNPSFLAAGV